MRTNMADAEKRDQGRGDGEEEEEEEIVGDSVSCYIKFVKAVLIGNERDTQ